MACVSGSNTPKERSAYLPGLIPADMPRGRCQRGEYPLINFELELAIISNDQEPKFPPVVGFFNNHTFVKQIRF